MTKTTFFLLAAAGLFTGCTQVVHNPNVTTSKYPGTSGFSESSSALEAYSVTGGALAYRDRAKEMIDKTIYEIDDGKATFSFSEIGPEREKRIIRSRKTLLEQENE